VVFAAQAEPLDAQTRMFAVRIYFLVTRMDECATQAEAGPAYAAFFGMRAEMNAARISVRVNVKIRVADLGTQASMSAVRGHPCPRFLLSIPARMPVTHTQDA